MVVVLLTRLDGAAWSVAIELPASEGDPTIGPPERLFDLQEGDDYWRGAIHPDGDRTAIPRPGVEQELDRLEIVLGFDEVLKRRG